MCGVFAEFERGMIRERSTLGWREPERRESGSVAREHHRMSKLASGSFAAKKWAC
jgi:hypothetical protein